MPTLSIVLKALSILEPLIEELIKCLGTGQTPDFIGTLPSTLKSRVALNLRKAQQK